MVLQLLEYWFYCYSMLVAIYVLLGLAVVQLNRRLGQQKKIQRREPRAGDVRRDVRQSLLSLLTLSLFLGAAITLQQAGYGWRPLAPGWLNNGLMFLLSLVVFDSWFYWGHRLLHWRPLYRRIHAWHHRSVTPTVWSNNSDTFLDNCIIQSYFLLAIFILPIAAPVLVAHKIFDQVTGMVGHSGYEYSPGPLSRFPWPLLGVTFHDQHHQKFHCNYATHFSWWDRLMGTLDPDYDSKLKAFSQQ